MIPEPSRKAASRCPGHGSQTRADLSAEVDLFIPIFVEPWERADPAIRPRTTTTASMVFAVSRTAWMADSSSSRRLVAAHPSKGALAWEAQHSPALRACASLSGLVPLCAVHLSSQPTGTESRSYASRTSATSSGLVSPLCSRGVIREQPCCGSSDYHTLSGSPSRTRRCAVAMSEPGDGHPFAHGNRTSLGDHVGASAPCVGSGRQSGPCR